MKIGVVGNKGYVGSSLIKRGALSIPCDVTDLENVESELDGNDFDVLVYAAAFGGKDSSVCEDNPRKALEVNALGVSNVLRHYIKGKIIYLSSDHVFPDGAAKLWISKELSDRKPENRYGMSKMMGEEVVKMGTATPYIVRTSKLFSYTTLKSTISELQSGQEKVFTNVISRSFCHLEHFLDGLMYFIEHIEDMPEVLHIAGNFSTTYYNFWYAIAQELGIDTKLLKARNHKIKGSPRPFKGGLDVQTAISLKVPIYSFADGIELLKKEMEE